MAKKSVQQAMEELARLHEPLILAAYLLAVREIVGSVQLTVLASYIERRDFDGALRAMNLDRSAYRAIDQAINIAYEAGGNATVAAMPAIRTPDTGRVIVRFDVRNPRAEAYLTEHSSALVTGILDDTRSMVRQVLTEGMIEGRNPRATALGVIGRVNRATGRREGGLLGLNSLQERAVAKARAALLSGDPEAMRGYLALKRRDKRFDKQVLAAIKAEKPLAQEAVDKVIGKLSDSYLKLRGETIARTETLAALNSSQAEAWHQMADTGAIARQDIRKVWIATQDARTRDAHRHLDRESVGLNEPFPNGMMYPGDPAGGAENLINCRCTMITRFEPRSNLPRLQ